MNRLCALLTGLWLGMQIMAGYVAAPILFERLGKQVTVRFPTAARWHRNSLSSSCC